jgi:hypothetical protein
MRRSALALAAGLCVTGLAHAQSSDGSIYGSTAAHAAVSIRNVETGQSRSATADGKGGFSFSKLPPGRYEVIANGVKRDVVVQIGSNSELRFDDNPDLQRITVSVSRIRSMIDVNTTETNSVFTSQQVQALPVVRNVNAVAYLAPGVVQGDDGLGDGNLPSFGGASVAENGYYVNGFDVTNIRNFLSYAELPFEAIAQFQVKTGGYGAEYGRSLGGVISLLTKRGTNEFKAGGAIYVDPKKLASTGQNVRDLEPDNNKDFQNYTVFNQHDERQNLRYNLFAGGPIVKDRFFAFALLEGRKDTLSDFKRDGSTKTTSDRPNGLLKLDWTPSETLAFELTAISNKKREKIVDHTSNDQPFATTHLGAASHSERTSGGTVAIAKASAFITDNLTVSALLGRTQFQQPRTTGGRTLGQDCPVVLETNLAEIGCWTGPFPGVGGRDPAARPADTDTRKAGRLDVEYVLGAHTIRAGVDNQKFTSYEGGGSLFTGGAYWRYFVTPASGTVNGVPNALPAGTQYVRRRIRTTTSGEFDVVNEAAYVESAWKVNQDVLLYGGLRSESFDNRNGDGISFVKADNLIAPRIGASWDVSGDRTLKLYANAGRYYIPVASNTNIRATRGELSVQQFYPFNGRDPRTQAPLNLGAEIGQAQTVSNGSLPDPGTIADTKLKPMNQDEFIVGLQKALSKEWSIGVKGTHRKINDGMDDFCGHDPMKKFAEDNGFAEAFKTVRLADCIIVNPGRDVSLKMDLNGDGKLVEATIPASYFGLAKYERTFDAIELSLDKPFNGKWGLSVSYTWSKSRGTAEGYVQSNLDQDDAGITQDFDYASFTHGAKGYLPNDRRHVLKVYGTYAPTESLRLGMNAVVASGRPKSCIGFVPPSVPDFAESRNYTSASSYYCVGSDGVTRLQQRGTAGRTPWTSQFDVQLAYVANVGKGKLTLSADVFNVLNQQKAKETNEVRDFSRDSTLLGTGGRQNLNYDSPTSFQAPRSVRLSARYEF